MALEWEMSTPPIPSRSVVQFTFFSMLLAEATVLVLFNEVLFEENHFD